MNPRTVQHRRQHLQLWGVGVLCAAAASFGGTGETNPAPRESDWFTGGGISKIEIRIPSGSIERLRREPREFVSGMVTEGKLVYPQVGIHLKGNGGSFRPVDDRPSLTLDFSRGEESRKFHGLRRIHLNNSVEDPSLVNEKLGSEFFQAAGLPAPRVTRARVVLNGKPLGFYVVKEGFTEDFLARYFQRIGGDLFEPELGSDIDRTLKRKSVRGLTQGQASVQALAAAAQEPDPALAWTRLSQELDMDRFVRFMAVEVLLGHRDGYCLARNNFRVYQDLDNGKLVFFPQGMDQLLGSADLPWRPHMAGLVANAIISTPQGAQAYETSFRSLFTNLFRIERWTNRIDQIGRELEPVATADEWLRLKEETLQVRERFVQRHAALQEQLDRPPLKRLEFTAGSACPEDWQAVERPGKGRIDQVNGPDGKPTLHIAAEAPSAASWRARALLGPGRYRFEGQVRVAGVQPMSTGAAQGAALRAAGSARSSERLTGDSPWRRLRTEFQVQTPTEPIELICELRAQAGEAWFALDSLKITLLEIHETETSSHGVHAD